MSDGLTLTSVLSTISCVEKTTTDGDECIVVVGFQKSVSVSVDQLNGGVVGDRGVVWCDSHHLAHLVVGIVDCEEASTLTSLVEEP